MRTAGWREWADLPEWGIRRVRAKLDTGARTSALHVASVEERPDGKVAFDVVPSRRSDRRVHIVTDVVRQTRVRSSNGTSSTRYVVRTRLRLGPIEREIELTLVDRGAMLHRLLVGRSGLAGIVVDASRRYVLSHRKEEPG
jgi:hypothetical protein